MTERLEGETSIRPVTVDLDERFFEEGADLEREMLASNGRPQVWAPHNEDEKALDPEILQRMRPEVRARRAKSARYVMGLSAGCALLGLAALVKHESARGDREVAAREMAAYAAAHAWENAAEEKRDGQALLEQGAFDKAVEAGKRSVELDPTDGEAWLLLGTAYRSLGRSADARRSFDACLNQATRGLRQCGAMRQ